jgi:hypothetical protein
MPTRTPPDSIRGAGCHFELGRRFDFQRLPRRSGDACRTHYWLCARRIIILHQIDPAAHFVPPHRFRVERLQQVAEIIGLLDAGV